MACKTRRSGGTFCKDVDPSFSKGMLCVLCLPWARVWFSADRDTTDDEPEEGQLSFMVSGSTFYTFFSCKL